MHPNIGSLAGPADYVIIAGYIAATFLVGFWSVRRQGGGAKNFFVAEKSLPWWVIGFTMVAASISAEQMLGEVGYGFDAGLVVSNWDLGVYPALLLMVLVFLPLYLGSGITTVPEYLERRYGYRTRLLFAVYTLFNNACVALVMVLALGATALKYCLGVSPIWGVIGLALFTGIYTVYGGMSAVAWTDTFQCVLLLLGGLVVFGFGLAEVPGGWAGLFSRMPDAHLVRPWSDPYVPWPGLLLLALSTNVWYCCTNQFYVQATLGAKSRWDGRMGVLLTAFLGPVLTLCFAFPGYIARDLVNQGRLPAITDANATYPVLIEHLLGPGWRGFLMAAILAAIMSTVSSIVNATASVFAVDVYQRWLRPEVSEGGLVRMGRLAGVGTLLVAVPLTFVALDYRYIFTYTQNAWCILAIPITIVFVFGALWGRASESAATGLFLGIIPFVAVPFIFGNKDNSWLVFPGVNGRLHLFNFAALLWVGAAVFMWGASVLGKVPDRERVMGYVWRRGYGEGVGRAGSWYGRVGLWSGVGGVMYALIYWIYW